MTQGACTYVIAQSAPLVSITEWVHTKKRTWKPFRAGSTLHLDHIGRRGWRTIEVRRPRTRIEVESYVAGGVTRRRFEHQTVLCHGDRDGFADFLAAIDSGVSDLGSIDLVCVDPVDHFGWISD